MTSTPPLLARRGILVLFVTLSMGSAGLAAYTRTPSVALRVDEALPDWARELYETRLPEVSWASARVAAGAPRPVIEGAFQPIRNGWLPREVARVMRDLDRSLTRPGVDPEVVRRHIEALNEATRKLGLPLHAEVRFERVAPKSLKWAVWIQTYRVNALRRAETPEGVREVHWLERLDELGTREDRLGWKRAGDEHAVVVLDVVRRHWREDLVPRLAAKPGRAHSRHLYARLRSQLLADLERATQAPVTEGVECQARFGAWLWLDSTAELPEEALECWTLARTIEAAIVPHLARRVDHHEIQHAIDDHDLDPPESISARCTGDESLSAKEITAEISAVLAEAARGPAPRLALAHFLSSGAELGGSRAEAAEVVLELMNPESTDVVSLLGRPEIELAHRAQSAYERLFGRDVPAVVFREDG